MSNRQQSFPGPDDITRIAIPNGITILVRVQLQQPVGGDRRSSCLRQPVRYG